MSDDRVYIHRSFIPALNKVSVVENGAEYLQGFDSPTDHDDLVRLYPFPPKDEKGEYDPPIDLHDGVSEIVYESGRTITVIVKGCHSKERVAREDKTPATNVYEVAAKDLHFYDPAERAKEKQAARDADAETLRNGTKTAEQLREENSLIPPGTKFIIKEMK